MSSVLSHDEVNALMSALSQDSAGAQARQSREALSYDLTSQDRVVRGRLPGLDGILDRTARAFVRELGLVLRQQVEVVAEPSALIKHSEFMSLLPSPGKIALLQLAPLAGHSLLYLDTELAGRLIGGLLGDSSGATEPASPSTAPTPASERILRRLVAYFSTSLERCWQPVQTIRAEIVRIEQEPGRAAIGTAGDLIVTSSFDIRLSENSGGRIFLGIPFASIEPLRKALGDVSANLRGAQDPTHQDAMRRLVHQLPVELRCILGEATMRVRDLVKLSPGDIVRLDSGPDTAVVGLVEGQPRLRGSVLVFEGNLAFVPDRGDETPIEIVSPDLSPVESSSPGAAPGRATLRGHHARETKESP